MRQNTPAYFLFGSNICGSSLAPRRLKGGDNSWRNIAAFHAFAYAMRCGLEPLHSRQMSGCSIRPELASSVALQPSTSALPPARNVTRGSS